MPRFLGPSPSWQKPPAGSPLNYSHPLISGGIPDILIPFWASGPPNGGTPLLDIANRSNWVRSGTTKFAWTGSPYGNALSVNTPSDVSDELDNATYHYPTTAITVLALIWSPSASPAHGTSLFGADSAGNNSVNECQIHCPWTDGVLYWDFGGGSGGSGRITWTPPSSWFGNWHALALTAGNKGRTIWNDGQIVSTATDATTRTNLGSSPDARIFTWWNGSTSLPWIGRCAFFAVWPRYLSNEQIVEWSQSPFSMFLPDLSKRTLFLPPHGLYNASGGVLVGGTATVLPLHYTGKGGAVVGGSARTFHTTSGGGTGLGRHEPVWQKPPPGAKINWSHPHSAGLVDAWMFNEQDGQLVRSLFGLTGAGTGLAWGASSEGPHLNLTGNSAGNTATHYAVVKNPEYLTGAYRATIEARVFISGLPGGSNSAEIYKQDQKIILRNVSASGNFWDFIVWPGTHVTRTNIAITNNTWYTVHGVFDGNAGHVYINGVEQTYSVQQTGAGPFPRVTTDLGIGADPSNTEAFQGNINRILVWNRALSIGEIRNRIANPYAFVQPIRTFYFARHEGNIGTGGVVVGGSAVSKVNPKRYTATGGVVVGGSARTTHQVPGGSMPSRGIPSWQKPPPRSLVNWSHPQSAGLVHAWIMNDVGSNTLTDLVSAFNKAVLTGTGWSPPTSNVAPTPPEGGLYARFDQTPNTTPTKYADAGILTQVTGASQLTVELEAWVVSFSDWNVLIGSANIDDSNGQFYIHYNNNLGSGLAGFRVIGAGGSHLWDEDGSKVTAGQINRWVVYHGTYNSAKSASAGKIYHNGLLASTDTAGNVGLITNPSNYPFRMGSSGANTRSSNVYIARVLIWTRELSQADIYDRIANPYAFILPNGGPPQRFWYITVPAPIWHGTGGIKVGGSAVTHPNPRQYVASGGVKVGGSATASFTPVPLTIVQSVTGNTSGTITLSATTAGTALFAVMSGGNGGPATSVTLPSGFTQLGPTTPTAIGTNSLVLACYLNNPGGLTSFTFGWNAGFMVTDLIEVSGVGPTLRLDQLSYGTLAGVTEPLTVTTGSLFTTRELIILGMDSGLGSPSLTPHGIFNSTGSAFLAFSWGIAADKTTSNAAVSATFTKNTGNSNTIGVVATFGVPEYTYIASGGIVVGGTAPDRHIPYRGTGGILVGGTGRPIMTKRGGGMPSTRQRPIWQRPPPFTNPNPSLLDLSKLPKANNIVDMWLLNEGGGSQIRSIWRPNITGQLVGVKWTGGPGGGSPVLDFSANSGDGTSSPAVAYGTLDTPSYLTGGTELTYEVLLKTGVTGFNNETSVWRLQGTANIQLWGAGSNQARLAVFTTTVNFNGVWLARSSTNLPTNVWTYVHMTWEPAPGGGHWGRVYFNGIEQPYDQQDVDPANGTILAPIEPLRIGKNGSDTEAWPGQIAHNITWNRALTPAEILQRVRDQYSFIRQPQPQHTWYFPQPLANSAQAISTTITPSSALTESVSHAKAISTSVTPQTLLTNNSGTPEAITTTISLSTALAQQSAFRVALTTTLMPVTGLTETLQANRPITTTLTPSTTFSVAVMVSRETRTTLSPDTRFSVTGRGPTITTSISITTGMDATRPAAISTIPSSTSTTLRESATHPNNAINTTLTPHTALTRTTPSAISTSITPSTALSRRAGRAKSLSTSPAPSTVFTEQHTARGFVQTAPTVQTRLVLTHVTFTNLSTNVSPATSMAEFPHRNDSLITTLTVQTTLAKAHGQVTGLSTSITPTTSLDIHFTRFGTLTTTLTPVTGLTESATHILNPLRTTLSPLTTLTVTSKGHSRSILSMGTDPLSTVLSRTGLHTGPLATSPTVHTQLTNTPVYGAKILTNPSASTVMSVQVGRNRGIRSFITPFTFIVNPTVTTYERVIPEKAFLGGPLLQWLLCGPRVLIKQDPFTTDTCFRV